MSEEKSPLPYKEVKEIADLPANRKLLEPVQQAQDIIERYYIATGQNIQADYISTSSVKTRIATDNVGTKAKVH